MTLKDGSAEGPSECVCAFSSLTRSPNNESRRIQSRVLKILKYGSMKYGLDYQLSPRRGQMAVKKLMLTVAISDGGNLAW